MAVNRHLLSLEMRCLATDPSVRTKVIHTFNAMHLVLNADLVSKHCYERVLSKRSSLVQPLFLVEVYSDS